MKRLAATTVLAPFLWSFSAYGTPTCADISQMDASALKSCIDVLKKEVEDNRSEIQALKTQNISISKKLCMMAVEMHRMNANSDSLKLIIEETCGLIKRSTVPKTRL